MLLGTADDYDYDDLNYDDEEVVYMNPEPDIDIGKYNPQLTSKPKTIEVDAGTTIRLPCEMKHLPGKMEDVWMISPIFLL